MRGFRTNFDGKFYHDSVARGIAAQKRRTEQQRKNSSAARYGVAARARVVPVVIPPYVRARRDPPRGFVGRAGDAKFFDTAAATYQVNTTGSITHLSIVPQGQTVNTREGKAFRCKSVRVRGTIQSDTTTVISMYHGALVWDYQPNKALPAITDIYDSVDPRAFPKKENAQRFKIIKEYRNVIIGNATTPGSGKESFIIDDFVKLPIDCNVLLTAADTTGVIGDTIQGALYWVTTGNIAAGTADGNFFLGFRLNFTDSTT